MNPLVEALASLANTIRSKAESSARPSLFIQSDGYKGKSFIPKSKIK
jgi:hypothetical protein